ncbi:hypothetical protein NUW54_g7875 [Trametes sanguinea]|uniref:Uncharacterized protein n=1 Tax=Trametes sanguinea TaxID=158606 RepID=A0ACC1PJ89_9APHY|nr:hypothetical protein NUW54_g7875 [Trametes sanguinea]
MRASSPSSSSDSFVSSPSTAPSTPPPEHATYCMVLHDASTGFLQALPVAKSSGDRVLLFNGQGPLKDLLADAARVLEDKAILEDSRWERVTAQDYGCDVVYYKTKNDVPVLAPSDDNSAVILDELCNETKPVSVFSV